MQAETRVLIAPGLSASNNIFSRYEAGSAIKSFPEGCAFGKSRPEGDAGNDASIVSSEIFAGSGNFGDDCFELFKVCFQFNLRPYSKALRGDPPVRLRYTEPAADRSSAGASTRSLFIST